MMQLVSLCRSKSKKQHKLSALKVLLRLFGHLDQSYNGGTVQGIETLRYTRSLISHKTLSWASCLFSVLANVALGAPAHDEDAELVVSNSLTLADVVVAARDHAPEALLKAAQNDQAEAYSALGSGLVPGRVNWQASYLADTWSDNKGISETEIGIEVGLWRLRERQITNALGQAYEQRVADFDAYLLWLASGKVRSVLADIAGAEMGVARELALAENLEAIKQVVAQSVFAGELAEIELLRLEQEIYEQQLALLSANSSLIDAQREYRVLTGLEILPADSSEQQVAETEAISSSHPLLRFLASEMEIAKRDTSRLALSSRERSTVSVGVRRAKSGDMLPPVDTFGFGVTIPLGGKRQSLPVVADARAEATRAEVALVNNMRELERQLHEAEHELGVICEALAISSERLMLSERRVAMALTAFDEAEMDLEQVLRVRLQMSEVARAHDALLQEQRALIARYNQAVGDIP
jgi:cobalt-zinc-cadmium efflux system outer membrane protein